MKEPSKPESPKRKPKDPRQERLAQALRDNLRRRKAQIRGRAAQAGREGEPPSGNEPGRDG